MAKKKPEASDPPRPAVLNGRMIRVPHDDDGKDQLPNVCECLWPVWTDEKCVRRPGTVRISPEGSGYVVTLQCPAEGVECRIRVNTLLGCLEALESVLRSGLASWGPDYETRKKMDKGK